MNAYAETACGCNPTAFSRHQALLTQTYVRVYQPNAQGVMEPAWKHIYGTVNWNGYSGVTRARLTAPPVGFTPDGARTHIPGPFPHVSASPCSGPGGCSKSLADILSNEVRPPLPRYVPSSSCLSPAPPGLSVGPHLPPLHPGLPR